MHGQVPVRALRKLLEKLKPSGFLLGTEVAAPPHGRYDLAKGGDALRQMSTEEASASAGAHVDPLAFPPLERTTMHLHRALASMFPVVPCSRWSEWHYDTPTSSRLDGYRGCSMGLRFLQHFIDARGSASDLD